MVHWWLRVVNCLTCFSVGCGDREHGRSPVGKGGNPSIDQSSGMAKTNYANAVSIEALSRTGLPDARGMRIIA
jgi:hypothetical protein